MSTHTEVLIMSFSYLNSYEILKILYHVFLVIEYSYDFVSHIFLFINYQSLMRI